MAPKLVWAPLPRNPGDRGRRWCVDKEFSSPTSAADYTTEASDGISVAASKGSSRKDAIQKCPIPGSQGSKVGKVKSNSSFDRVLRLGGLGGLGELSSSGSLPDVAGGESPTATFEGQPQDAIPSNMVNPTRLRFSSHKSRSFTSDTQDNFDSFSSAASELHRGENYEDHYRVEEQLGQGSYGVVYRVSCLDTGSMFAMKTVFTKTGKHGETEDEISHSSEFDHPYLVKLHAFYRQEGAYHLVMDLCTGGDLRSFCEGEISTLRLSNRNHVGGIRTPTAVRFTHQMLNAVAFLHYHGFCHRDIKPENFLLLDRGPMSDLKLADFGLACHVPLGGKLSNVVGTVYYAAPELLEKCYDERVDVWSLGVTAFGVCTNTLPFDGEDLVEYVLNVKAGHFHPRPEAWAGHPDKLRSAVMSMLQRHPEKRPTAKQLLTMNPWLRSPAPEAQCCNIA